jgi:Amt family ammonium transporter
LVYNPAAHWLWGTGSWLKELGAIDFASGMIAHMTSGISALVAAVMTGRRMHYGKGPMVPHNLPMTVLGAGLLWFGWFGFNAGRAYVFSIRIFLNRPLWSFSSTSATFWGTL